MKRHGSNSKQASLACYFTKKARVTTDEHVQGPNNHVDSQPGGSASATSLQFGAELRTSDVLPSQDLINWSEMHHASGQRASAASNTAPATRNTGVDTSEVGGVAFACSSNCDSTCNADVKPLDLGHYVTKTVVDPTLKEKLLRSPWNPPDNYNFPPTTTRNLRFQLHWVTSYPWLVYSELLGGALCKYCVLFAKECAGKGEHQRLGCFVTKAFTNYKKAIDAFKSHAVSSYHVKSASQSEGFLAVQSGLQSDIISKLDTAVKKQAEENRKNLVPIIETVMFFGRQEVALRGTDDCGPIDLAEGFPITNDGNFRALLRMRAACGDARLKKHIETSPGNAMYTSPQIQNEIIALCGKIIQSKIVNRVNASGCFSILADEATDISCTAQLSLCVRYVDKHTTEHCVLREDFLDFVPVYDLTGKALAHSILSTLRSHDLDLTLLCAQGYDGAASMSGHLNGVQAVIRETFPKALYVHCGAHSLNLALLHSCQLSSIRNCLGTVSSVCAFVKASPKRCNQLQGQVETERQGRMSLISFCQTRWVESHDALQRFLELYMPITRFLEDLEGAVSSDISSKACQLLSAITKPEFVVSLHIISRLFSLTLPLCKFLQKVDCDLSQACDHVDDIVSVLTENRADAAKEFTKIFGEACRLLSDVNVEMALPRTVLRQNQRCETPAANPEEYYRRNVYLPFLADLENQLKERFENHRSVVVGLQMILPKYCASASISRITDAAQFYLGERTSVIEVELMLWKKKWSKVPEADLPAGALGALSMCNAEFFPTIHRLLGILATLPVSTSTPERTFSTLRRLKNYLRNRVQQERLTGLALLSVHREVEVTPAQVLAEFCKLPRRKNFAV